MDCTRIRGLSSSSAPEPDFASQIRRLIFTRSCNPIFAFRKISTTRRRPRDHTSHFLTQRPANNRQRYPILYCFRYRYLISYFLYLFTRARRNSINCVYMQKPTVFSSIFKLSLRSVAMEHNICWWQYFVLIHMYWLDTTSIVVATHLNKKWNAARPFSADKVR